MCSMSCRVSGCRFADRHVTMGHRCGTCGLFGHGKRECGSPVSIANLTARHQHDRVANLCTVEGCSHRELHVTSAHHCRLCNRHGGNCCSHTRRRRLASSIVTRACPTCRVTGNVDLGYSVFSGGDCVVCMESKPCVVMETCRHANVCRDCMLRLEEV